MRRTISLVTILILVCILATSCNTVTNNSTTETEYVSYELSYSQQSAKKKADDLIEKMNTQDMYDEYWNNIFFGEIIWLDDVTPVYSISVYYPDEYEDLDSVLTVLGETMRDNVYLGFDMLLSPEDISTVVLMKR